MKTSIVVTLGLATLLAGCSKQGEPAGAASAAGATASVSAVGRATGSVPVGREVVSLAGRFAQVPDRGTLLAYPPQRVVRRDGAYTWHRAELSEAYARRAAQEGELSLLAPSGETLRFRFERSIPHANGDWTWVGSTAGGVQEAIITFGAKAAFGTIGQSGREPLRLTVQNGVSWLVETDPRLIAGINNEATRPTRPDFIMAPEVAGEAGRRKAASAAAAAASGDEVPTPAGADASSATTVDVVLGYTPGFVEYYGGDSQAQTRLNNMVAITNEAYVNSQVGAQVRLVRTVLVHYTDTNKNQTALEELTGFVAPSTRTTPAAAFNELRAARDQYGADLVSLVRRFNTPENDGCGIAWLLGGGGTRNQLFTTGSESFGYSIVGDGRDTGDDGKSYFCREETLAHEFGHNMGSQHDRDTADGDDNVLEDKEYGVFDYSFGYKTLSGTGNFFTVMAYGDSGQTRFRVFSNPRITFCGGLPCGVEGQADNARSLSQAIPVVAQFRATVVPAPTPPPTTPLPPVPAAPYDVNADGKSDIFLQGVGTAMAYWAMNGTTRTFDSYLGHGGTGWYRVAYGNFDGAGGADVLWSNGVQLKIWFNDGRGSYVVYPMGSYGNGWQPFAASDVNGDGKSDILFRGGSAMAYWLVDGARVIGDSYAGDGGTGFRAMTAGDFNADGRDDIVWQSSTQLKIWLNGGATGYTPYIVGNYANGWEPFASGDVNGDRKPDLIFRGGTALAYWQLNGATFVSSHYLGDGGTGYRAFAIADYNGDGATDVGWENGSNIKLWMNNGVGSYSPNIIGSFICCWKPDGGY